MQSYYGLFGGNSDGLNIPTRENGEVITMAVGVAGIETYGYLHLAELILQLCV
jgi:hypothetical protein